MTESPSMMLWGLFVASKQGQVALMSKDFRLIAQAYYTWMLALEEDDDDGI